MSYSADSRVAIAPGRFSCEVAGDLTILNTDSSTYYNLSGSGVRVWTLLEQGERTVGALSDILVGEYEIEPRRCVEELNELLDGLIAAGLVVVQPGGAG